MSNYIAIAIGNSDYQKIDSFHRLCKSNQLESTESSFKYFVSELKYRSYKPFDFHVLYCVFEDTDWSEKDQGCCNRLCHEANERELSYCVINFDKRTNEVIKKTNHYRNHYEYLVEGLFGVRSEMVIFDNCRKTFEDWMLDNFEHNEMADLCEHGAAGGFSGLIHYHETTALYDKYHEDIWEMLYEDYDEYGNKHCVDFIASFNESDVASDAQFKNLLVWYAAERIARNITQGEYLDEDENDESDDSDE